MRNPISDKIIRTCIICGECFHPKSTRQKCCNKPITYSCIVCGKDIPGICTTATRNATCSKECAVAYSNEQKNKRNALLTRKCKFCGREFTPTTAQNEYCQGPHYKQCAVCGKQFEVDVRKGEPARTCSNECRYKLQLGHRDIEQEKINQKQALLEKYGVENSMLIPGAKEKLIETNRKRYGADWYTQTDEYAERVRRAPTTRTDNEEINMYKDKVCPICGDSFHPNSSRQLYCNKRVMRKCIICEKDFESSCNATYNKCCSKACTVIFAKKNSEAFYLAITRTCELCGKEFNPRNNTQRICDDNHKRICVVCGNEFMIESNHSKRLQDNRVTCSETCHNAYKFRNGNPFSDNELREKAKVTMLERYGVAYPGQSKEIQEKMRQSYLENSGYDHPSHNPNVRKGKNYRHSSLEKRAENVFQNNKIEYIHEYVVSKEGIYHSFDFFLPKYRMLVDIDGDYYHGYLDDSNGLQVSEDRDSIRPLIVPKGCTYFVVVESAFSSDIQRLLRIIKQTDQNIFNYEEYMMNWCRSMTFPFPEYDEKRMIRDYNNLCKTSMEKYNSYVKYGLSTIRNFHKSIYHAKVRGYKSLYEAWNDDTLIKKAIANRMMYVDSVDPSKVLRGLYISKVAPKVSVFNPVLAKYLCDKYFSDVNTIIDTFSGFSGRLLGSCASGKHYIGSDLNVNAVKESNQIIDLHNLDAEVFMRNVLEINNQQYEHAGLLTCPPYLDKEQYDSETVHLTCEQWIDEIVCRYSCKRYLFVVDDPGKYFNNVVEEITTKSYFCNIHEYVVLIG